MTRFAIQDALVDLVEHRLRNGPLLLMIDDLHWADTATIGTVMALTSVAHRSPLLIVLSYRPVPRNAAIAELIETVSDRAKVLLPRTLTAEESTELMRRRGCSGLPFPVERLGGNPYLLVSATDATQTESHTDAAWQAEIRWAVLGRLRGLSEATIGLIRISAALGRPFNAADLVIVAQRDGLAVIDALDEAERAGVLVPSGSHLVFVHDLLRETMLQELSEPLVVGLHRAIWQTMSAARRHASTYASHVVLASAPGDLDAVSALCEAADELIATDPARAVELLQHASELAAPLAWTERGEVATKLASTLTRAGRLGDVAALGDECDQWPIRSDQLARIEYESGDANRFIGRTRKGVAQLRQAIARGTLPAAKQAWAWTWIAQSESLAHGPESDHRIEFALAEAMRLAEPAGDRAALVQTWCATSHVAWSRGRIDDALTAALKATDLARTLGNVVWPSPALAHSLALLSAGDPLAALSIVNPWGRRAEQIGDLWALSRMEAVTMMCNLMAGRWSDITGHCDAIIRVGTEAGGASGQPLAQAIDGLAALFIGESERAQQRAAEARTVIRSSQIDPAGLPFAAWLEAELAEAAGNVSTGHAILDSTFDRLVGKAPPAAFWIGAAVARRALDRNDMDRFEHVTATMENLMSDTATAHLGDLFGAARRLDFAAIESIASTGARHSVLVCHDTLLIASSLRLRAGGIHRTVARETSSPRRGASFGPTSVSAAETAVLDLLSEGLTNAVIAERLHLSKRTVESHVSRMYQKLSVTTRVELARFGLGLTHEPSHSSRDDARGCARRRHGRRCTGPVSPLGRHTRGREP